MASILRLMSRNLHTPKNYPATAALIETIQKRHTSIFLSNINELTSKRTSFQADKANLAKFEGLKQNIESIKPDTQIMANSSSGSDYLDLIYAARTDKDIDFIVQFLRLSVKQFLYFWKNPMNFKFFYLKE